MRALTLHSRRHSRVFGKDDGICPLLVRSDLHVERHTVLGVVNVRIRERMDATRRAFRKSGHLGGVDPHFKIRGTDDSREPAGVVVQAVFRRPVIDVVHVFRRVFDALDFAFRRFVFAVFPARSALRGRVRTEGIGRLFRTGGEERCRNTHRHAYQNCRYSFHDFSPVFLLPSMTTLFSSKIIPFGTDTRINFFRVLSVRRLSPISISVQ